MQCDDGCGECCGLVPATETEFRRIERYIKEHDITPIATTNGTCPLYQGGKCTVYPVRPLICQLFGHSEHKMMQCFRGYNVNIPEREVQRMITANGKATRVLHELLPGFAEEANTFGRREDAKSILTGGPTVKEQFEIVADEIRSKA
jgi:Fe-S-cluster containining protein